MLTTYLSNMSDVKNVFFFFQVQSKMFSALTANRDRQWRTPFYKLSFFSLYTVSCFFMVTENHLCLNMTLPSWPLVSSIYKVLCENCLLFPIILRRCIWEALTVLLWGPADQCCLHRPIISVCHLTWSRYRSCCRGPFLSSLSHFLSAK